MDNKEFAETMRKIAQDLRKEAQEIEHKKAVKCAQTLIAAHGLSKFKEMLQGGAQ